MAYSQNAPIKLRHMEGFKSIKVGTTLNFGANENTNTLIVGYNHYLDKNMFAGADLTYEYGDVDYSTVKNANLNLYFNYSVYELNSLLYLNVLGGIFGGVEHVESNVIETAETFNSFVYGACLGLSLEVYVSNRICIEPFYKQYFQGGSQLGNTFYNKGISLKFNF